MAASLTRTEVGVGRAWRPFLSRPVRDLAGLPKTLASAGPLEARLATTRKEIRLAQKLRYRVFFEEGGANAGAAARLIRRDICAFDRVCDHLIVVDTSLAPFDGTPEVVGAYRLLRQSVAQTHFGFYSAREFAVDALIARHPDKRFLELGRSCVADGYRGKRTLELLWRGIWTYALHHGVDVMIGCASFPGTSPQRHAAAFDYLRREGGDGADWAIAAQPGRAAPSFEVAAAAADPRALHRALPPLIKGYWRLGAKFSRDSVVDAEFGTTDVFVVLPVEDIRDRYLQHFAPGGAAAQIAA